MENLYNFSIVIPTENRSHLLSVLLESLKVDRDSYVNGSTEVLVVDSSKGEEKEKIMRACHDFDAMYYAGDVNVRKKRNHGIMTAQYPYIIFLDSDVTAKKGLLTEYYKAYQQNENNSQLGGILGYTEFVGKVNFWWKVIEQTTLIDCFSFAKKYPFQSWTIGNNVSFRKDVLLEIGMFDENFPFRLGGDDLEMSYRITKAGYLIKSCPDAVTYHTMETWNNFRAIHNRAKRWGTMDRVIANKHPEIYRAIIPKSYILILNVFIASTLFSIISGKWLPMIIAIIWVLLNSITNYVFKGTKTVLKNPINYFFARLVQGIFEIYSLKQSIKEKSVGAFYKGLIFNSYQIKYGMINESLRIRILYTTYIIAFLFCFIIYSNG